MPRRSSVVPVCLLALAALAPAAHAAYPGRNGAVAYVAKSGGTTKLLTRSGSRISSVLEGAGIAGPVWSPQGRRLAAVRSGPEGRDVWVVGHDGQGARQLTAAGDATDPAWSPAGDEVAYAGGARGERDILAVGADGAQQRAITSASGDERDPAWSSRGQIAYVRRSSRGDDLYVVPAAGGRPRRLTRTRGNEHSPAWSPDGRRLVFVRGGRIWTIGSDGRRAARAGRLTGSSPAWSPDGRRLVLSTGRPVRRWILSASPGGRARNALSRPRSDGRQPDWQPTGFDPVVAAAGDIACDPQSKYFNNGTGVPRHCGQSRTGNLLLRADYWNVLPLGDTQYQHGEYESYLASYDLSWGRTKHLQRPIIGNHEYATGGTGYWDYFDGIGALDGPAGERGKGYYSFDVGSWHVVALNSECTQVPGGCAAGSPQQQWLAADLAAHPSRCTLALWHTPRFSSHHGGNAVTNDLWLTLQEAGADVALTAHHHFYERLAPMTADGAASSQRGIRQFIVGTGGGSMKSPEGSIATSQNLITTTLGILRLRLRGDGYEWRFVSASADPASDVGSDACH